MTDALKLYELTAQFKALEQLGESDDLPTEVIRDTLEGIEGDFDTKAVQVAKFVLSLEANGQAILAAAQAMQARAARVAKRADAVRNYLLFHLQALEKKRIESAEIVISRRANPPAVIVTDERALPAKYWIQPEPPPLRIDRRALLADLKAGERIFGAFVEAGERLEIKP